MSEGSQQIVAIFAIVGLLTVAWWLVAIVRGIIEAVQDIRRDARRRRARNQRRQARGYR